METFHSKNFNIICFILFLFFGCNAGSKDYASNINLKPGKDFDLVSPVADQVLSFTDTVHFTIKSRKKNIHPDSVYVFINGNLVICESASPLSFSKSVIFSRVGRQEVRLKIYYNDSLTNSLTTRITVLSDIEPKILTYRLIRKIPHDPDAYIQGLFFYNNFLYESTGQKGYSRLMKIDPKDGKIVLDRHLGDEFFGEGITRWSNYIYQLTYQQKVGFVYDLESFQQIREFNLQTMEGWGITCDDKSLIVSDGSSILYFYDPEYYSQTRQLDVCDNHSLVTQLNELEYLDGIIWSNVYGQPYLLKIDAESGKVLAKLNLEALYPSTVSRDLDHVLNGIAYSSVTRTFFVSGKLWPVMYEIHIQE